MVLEHKAFVFDYSSFQDELMDILVNSLKTETTDRLKQFILQNLSSLKDPYEGDMLDSDWESLMEVYDAHQYGDFAITKFYNPQDDVGLGYDWQELDELLNQELDSKYSILLGSTIGSKDNLFDPGKIGFYFQSLQQVNNNLEIIKTLIREKPELVEPLKIAIAMFQSAVSESKGLYITF